MNSTDSNNKYPKTLIIGNPFNNKSGGGITMSNLFRGWPKDRLALATNANINIEAEPSICENYFQLGFNGKLHPFPFNIVLSKVYCGPVKLKAVHNSTSSASGPTPGRFKKIYNVLMNFLDFIGLYNFFYTIKIDDGFKKWVEEFSPDIIYSQLGSLGSIRFISDLSIITGKPVALHIMDDWPEMVYKRGLFHNYRKKLFIAEFKDLINRSAVLMSIGDAMSEEYKKRYNRDFTPFHNPIEINNWLPSSRNEWLRKDKFTILYAGRIGLGMKSSVLDIARVVNHLLPDHQDLFFEIQTPDFYELEGSGIFNENVTWVKPIDYNKLPGKFAEVDLLLLPLDFDPEGIKFLKYSFQTKISEYMISGTPVLVYAPEETSTAKYAAKDEWAYVVTERSDLILENAILDLYSDTDLRKRLGERAKQLAETREDSKIVKEKFRDCLGGILQ